MGKLDAIDTYLIQDLRGRHPDLIDHIVTMNYKEKADKVNQENSKDTLKEQTKP